MGCGRPEKEIVGANNAACCPSSVPTVSEAFWGENPPGKGGNVSRNAFSDPYHTWKGAFGPTRKKRVGGLSPPPTHNFACSLLSSPPKQDPIFNMKKHHFGYIPNDMSATCHPDTYMSVVWTLFLTSQNPTNPAKVLSITKRM